MDNPFGIPYSIPTKAIMESFGWKIRMCSGGRIEWYKPLAFGWEFTLSDEQEALKSKPGNKWYLAVWDGRLNLKGQEEGNLWECLSYVERVRGPVSEEG